MSDRAAPPSLVLVYNADSGRWHAALDTLHKLLSPSTYACSLCALTHGPVGPRAAWTAALATLPVPVAFLHRDEVAARYGALDVALPAVIVDRDGRPDVVLDGPALDALPDLDALVAAVRDVAEKIVREG